MARVEFHFDLGSPNAYLSHLVIPEIEQRTGVKFEYIPILLGGVFKLTNNRSPAQRSGVPAQPIAKLGSYTWWQHCNGLFQTPTAA